MASVKKPKMIERQCQSVPEPPAHRLNSTDLFSNPSNAKDKPNLEVLKQHIILEGRLTDEAALRIIETGKRVRSSAAHLAPDCLFFSLSRFLRMLDRSLSISTRNQLNEWRNSVD